MHLNAKIFPRNIIAGTVPEKRKAAHSENPTSPEDYDHEKY